MFNGTSAQNRQYVPLNRNTKKVDKGFKSETQTIIIQVFIVWSDLKKLFFSTSLDVYTKKVQAPLLINVAGPSAHNFTVHCSGIQYHV